MVFLYPTPTPKPQELYLDPSKIDLTGLNPIPTNAITTTTTSTTAAAVCTTTNTTAFSAEDPTHKKVRKPYTITKSRESWTDQEHDKFLEALHLFDRDWKKIEAFVGTKTVIQIRSHAQKYFLKVQKNGTSEHLPPPRPKRKASHPYPQKASKKAPVVSQVPGPFPSSSASLEPALASWNYSCVTPVSVSHAMKGDTGLTIPTDAHNSSYTSSNESDQRIWPTGDASDQERRNHGNQMRVMPDFAQVYSFIGSVFDPNASGHLQKLKKMDPIDIETALLLMKNLSDNLKSPEFENYRRLLSSDDVDAKKAKFNRPFNNLCATRPQRAIPTA